MGNRRVILFLLLGIVVCSVLLLNIDELFVWSSSNSVPEKDTLVSSPLDTAQRMTIERGALYAGLKRHGKDGAWELYSPFPSRVDQAVVARLLDAIEHARVTDRIRSSEMRRRELSLRDFGFAPASVCISIQEGERTDTVFIGATAPAGNEVYVRVAAVADQVMSVSSELLDSVPMTLDAFRSREIVSCERSRVRILEIKAQGKPFIRLSKESGTWRLTQPSEAPADDRKVTAMLDALYAVKAAQFVWPSATRAEEASVSESALKTRLEVYGLGTDMLLQISAQDAATAEPSRLVFGNSAEGMEGFRYVLMPGGQAIATVSNSVVTAFQCTPSDLRDMRLFFERPDRVTRLEIAVEGVLFVLTQQNGIWQLVSPIAGRADQVSVTEALERLLRLNAVEILSTTNTVDAALAQPVDATDGTSRIEVVTHGGSSTKLLFKPEYVDGKAYYAVSMTNATLAYRVEVDALPAVLLNASAALALYDRTMLSFTNNSIQRISTKLPSGGTEVVERDKEGAWHLQNTSGVLSTEAMTERLELLSKLTADRVEKPSATSSDADAYGLKKPWMEMSVSVDAGDAIRKTILVGSQTSEGARYAMVRGQDLVFVLDAKTVALLVKSLVRTP
jgi:hypothetical protein